MYISEIITDSEIAKWQRGNNILINAQTGKGKSYWMQNQLAQFCSNHNYKVLILSNRTLLKEQNKNLSLPNVECINYQHIERIDNIANFLNQYDIINFDECHYFFKDSSFNKNTDVILKYAVSNHPKQIFIFASATPQPLYYANISLDFAYRLPTNYNFIKTLSFFKKVDETYDYILNSPAKSICFFSEAGDAFSFAIEHKDNVAFVCSTSNKSLKKYSNKIEMDNITNNSKFTTKILATTSVLDNGVNIKDPEVKNIVIDFYDPINIIQMLGRKRFLDSEDNSINLFIREPNMTKIRRMIHKQKETTTYSEQRYIDYLTSYYQSIAKIDFAGYWASFFSIDLNRIVPIEKFLRLVNTLARYKEMEIPRTTFYYIFSPFFINIENVKIATINKFLQETSLPYKIISKQARRNGIKKRCLFVKLSP